MSDPNFLNSLSERKYISYYRWVRNSYILFFFAITSLTLIHLRKIYKLNLLRKEKKAIEEKLINFDDFIKKKSNIEDYILKSEKQLEKFQEISSEGQRVLIFNFFTELIKIVPDDLYLQNFEFNSKEGIFLKGYCSQSYIVNDFIERINHMNFIEDTKLEYLKSQEFYKEEEVEQLHYLVHEFFIKVKIKKEN